MALQLLCCGQFHAGIITLCFFLRFSLPSLPVGIQLVKKNAGSHITGRKHMNGREEGDECIGGSSDLSESTALEIVLPQQNKSSNNNSKNEHVK